MVRSLDVDSVVTSDIGMESAYMFTRHPFSLEYDSQYAASPTNSRHSNQRLPALYATLVDTKPESQGHLIR